MRIKRLCSCGRIVDGQCECTKAKNASKSDYRAGKHERYGRGWDRLSKRYREQYPLCQMCEQECRTTLAVDVHHIVKVSDSPELLLDWDNLLSVCRLCHVKLDRNGR